MSKPVNAFAAALSLLDDPVADDTIASVDEPASVEHAALPQLSSDEEDEGETSTDKSNVNDSVPEVSANHVHFDLPPEPSTSESDIEPKAKKAKIQPPPESEHSDVVKEVLPMVKELSAEDEINRVKTLLLLANMSPEQLERYETMRRASLPKSCVRKLILQATGCQASPNIIIAISGMVKVFIGELIEEALDFKDAESSTEDPLEPRHLRLAFNKMDEEDRLYPARPRRNPF